jgi:hypothetical protein
LRAGQRDGFELSKLRERLCERGSFGAARFGAKRQDDSQLVENDGGVFDEHGIGKSRFRRQRNEPCTEFFKKVLVGTVLLLRAGKIDRFSVDKGEFAMDDGRTDGTRYSSEHGKTGSLHEIFLRDREGVYRLASETS